MRALLGQRCRLGKEDPVRLPERMGIPGRIRPEGPLIWFHAASVGEAQSTLILIDALLAKSPAQNILVTTGTVTSARLMASRLPSKTLHQFYPLDHPAWVKSFLDHWRPDLVLWMESELWPNMLAHIRERGIPAALINARLSPRSFKYWRALADDAREVMGTFKIILAQTPEDAASFRALGADNVLATDNLKYCAAPLPFDRTALDELRKAVSSRPLWLYASTHDGEEALACRLHAALKKQIPDLLTIVVPRHPERRQDILAACKQVKLTARLRRTEGSPMPDDDIYVADTLGEMGLFYSLSHLACIGRSFSLDGGGGHNPIEAAQLSCAVMHGPYVQNLAAIYRDMDEAGAALHLNSEEEFRAALEKFLTGQAALETQREKAAAFVNDRTKVLQAVMAALEPFLKELSSPRKKDRAACA